MTETLIVLALAVTGISGFLVGYLLGHKHSDQISVSYMDDSFRRGQQTVAYRLESRMNAVELAVKSQERDITELRNGVLYVRPVDSSKS